jgi:hypothetical protein
MRDRLVQLAKYVLYISLSNVLFALVVIVTYTVLSRISLFLSAVGNIALIIIWLLLDRRTHKLLDPQLIIDQIKHEKDAEGAFRSYRLFYLDSFVSFKASLYLFYIFILLFSLVLDYYPGLVGAHLSSFLNANRYSIVLLVAFDELIRQFSKDRTTMKAITAEAERYWDEREIEPSQKELK